jgi:phospholipase/carboxylesterase
MSTLSYAHALLPGWPGGPLLFLFHDAGGSENDLIPLARQLLPGAGIVAPRGDVTQDGVVRFFRSREEAAYDMGDLALRTRKMAAFVRAHRNAARPCWTLGLGHANGANILAAVMFHDPTLFDGAVLMRPLIPYAPIVNGDLAGRRILVTATRDDPLSPDFLISRLSAHLQAARADLAVSWHVGGHEIGPSEVEATRRFLAPFAKPPAEKGKV